MFSLPKTMNLNAKLLAEWVTPWFLPAGIYICCRANLRLAQLEGKMVFGAVCSETPSEDEPSEEMEAYCQFLKFARRTYYS